MNTLVCAALAVYVGSGEGPGARITSRRATGRRVLLLIPVVLLVVLTRGTAVVLASIMVCGLATWKILALRSRRRRTVAAEAAAAVLGSIVSNLRAGATPHQAMVHLAHDAPEGLQEICAVAAHRSAAGVSPAAVFADAPSPHDDLRDVGKLWFVAEARGIALAGLLEHMQHRIDAKLRHMRSTMAALQGPQATALILSALPLVGIAMGVAMGANPWGFLSGNPLGGVLLVAGTFLTCAGFYWVDRIVVSAAHSGGRP